MRHVQLCGRAGWPSSIVSCRAWASSRCAADQKCSWKKGLTHCKCFHLGMFIKSRCPPFQCSGPTNVDEMLAQVSAELNSFPIQGKILPIVVSLLTLRLRLILIFSDLTYVKVWVILYINHPSCHEMKVSSCIFSGNLPNHSRRSKWGILWYIVSFLSLFNLSMKWLLASDKEI